MDRGLRTAKSNATDAIEQVANSLETAVQNIDIRLPKVNASGLPEYKQALDAIRNYKLALGDQMTKVYGR
jgi:hypothetical protein